MIKFKGELSEATKKFVVKNEARFARTIAYFFAVPIIIVGVVLLISTRDMIYLLIPFVAVIYVLLFGAKPNKKSYDIIMPTCITIEENMLTTEEKNLKGA